MSHATLLSYSRPQRRHMSLLTYLLSSLHLSKKLWSPRMPRNGPLQSMRNSPLLINTRHFLLCLVHITARSLDRNSTSLSRIPRLLRLASKPGSSHKDSHKFLESISLTPLPQSSRPHPSALSSPTLQEMDTF